MGEVRCAMTFQGDYGYQDGAESIILSACGAKRQLQRKTTISDCQYCQFMTLVNSASKAPPICLPPKGAKFCHTLNILLVGHWCCHALLQLFFNSSATSCQLTATSQQTTIRVAGL
jgi:hypothetical protein